MSIFKRGNKYWIGFRFNHQRHRYASPENSLAGAKVYEAIIRQKLARGESINPNPKKKEEEEIPIFKDFSRKWFDVYVKSNNKYSEILNKKSVLRAHLVPFFGDKRIDKIKSLDIESFKAEKIKAGLCNKTVNNLLIVLSKCFKMAEEWEVITSAPKLKLLKVPPQKVNSLTEEESQLLLDNCDGWLKDMILVALKTGLRFGELIALEWSDIDFKNNVMTVKKSISRGRIGSTKSNKIRYIPLQDEISQVLAARAKKSGFVFADNKNEPLKPKFCLTWLHKACSRAGLRKIGWHSCRHGFGSHLAQKGVPILSIKDLLGHSDVQTTMRYAHLTQLATREAINTLNKNSGPNMATIHNLGSIKMLSPILIESEIVQKT
jgi:integrase